MTTANLLLILGACLHAADESRFFEIQVVDADTRRGIPMVELTTVDQVTYLTDNAGRIAYDEPSHANQVIFFSIKSHGFEPNKDGFGFPGVRLTIKPGAKEVITIKRKNLAERLYRLTGQGLYRDSVRLGYKTPLKEPMGAGMVAGQDSVFAEKYQGRIWWFWGDTLRLSYPLGHFRMAGATTPLALRPDQGIDYDYFVDKDGFSRPMAELPEQEGVVWLDGFAAIPTDQGETLVAHYSRRKSLVEAVEQGMMRFNDDRGVFERVTTLPLRDDWRFLRDHTSVVKEADTEYLVFGNPFPVTRVNRSLDDVMNPDCYESWSCVDPAENPSTAKPRRREDGHLDWRWQHGPPVTQQTEQHWLKHKLIKAEEVRYLPKDTSTGRMVTLHSGTTRWNERTKRWVVIAVEATHDKISPSFLGEVWYCESDTAQGPWTKCVRVLTHDKQTFYNPCHHPFLDEDGGRVIYFEGTYCNTFTNSPATPRYNYNQMMYRLDLDHPSIKAAFRR